MSLWLLILTHLMAFGAGVGVAWVWVVRKIRVREVEGHPAIEYRPCNKEINP